MWNLPKGSEFLENVKTIKIIEAYKKERIGKSKIRLLAAIKRRQGKSIDKIANDLERSRHTVYSWICRFIDRGLEGAYSKHRQFRCCC